jgi:uncharacterized protein YhhL (DUF1145 family)
MPPKSKILKYCFFSSAVLLNIYWSSRITYAINFLLRISVFNVVEPYPAAVDFHLNFSYILVALVAIANLLMCIYIGDLKKFLILSLVSELVVFLYFSYISMCAIYLPALYL